MQLDSSDNDLQALFNRMIFFLLILDKKYLEDVSIKRTGLKQQKFIFSLSKDEKWERGFW